MCYRGDASTAPPAFPNFSASGQQSPQLDLAHGKSVENNEVKSNPLPTPTRWPSHFLNFMLNGW